MSSTQYPIHQAPVLSTNQFPETTSEDRYHEPWSEPVRFKIVPALAIAIIAASGQSFAPLPIPNQFPSSDKYWYRFDEPVRHLAGLAPQQQQFLAIVEAAPFPETPSEDRFHQPWSEPSVKAKDGLRAASQQFLALTEAAPFPETPTEDRYHEPWSEPVRIKPGLPAPEQFSAAWIYLETPQLDKWGYQWREPVWAPVGLKANQQAAFPAFVEFPPFGEIITESRWHFAWSEPVRIKPRLETDAQKADWLVEFPPFAETVTESRWHFAWSEPVRIKPGLPAAEQLDEAFGRAAPFPETVTESRWHFAWSEPVRVKPGLGAPWQYAHWYTEAAPFSQEGRWHFAWSEPVRLKVGIESVLQPHALPFPIVPPFLGPANTLRNTLVRVRLLGLNVPVVEWPS